MFTVFGEALRSEQSQTIPPELRFSEGEGYHGSDEVTDKKSCEMSVWITEKITLAPAGIPVQACCKQG